MKKDTFMNKKSYQERKQMIYDLVRTQFYVPMKEKELAIFFDMANELSESCCMPLSFLCRLHLSVR